MVIGGGSHFYQHYVPNGTKIVWADLHFYQISIPNGTICIPIININTALATRNTIFFHPRHDFRLAEPIIAAEFERGQPVVLDHRPNFGTRQIQKRHQFRCRHQGLVRRNGFFLLRIVFVCFFCHGHSPSIQPVTYVPGCCFLHNFSPQLGQHRLIGLLLALQ